MLILQERVLLVEICPLAGDVFYEVAQNYFIALEVVVVLLEVLQLPTAQHQLSEDDLQQVVEFVGLEVHEFGEAVQLGSPLRLTAASRFGGREDVLQFLQLPLHGLAEVLQVLRQFHAQHVAESRLDLRLHLLVLLLVLELREGELVLLLLALLAREQSPPVEPSLRWDFLLLGLGFVFLLQEGEDVVGWFYFEVEVLEGVQLDVFGGEEFVDALVGLGLPHVFVFPPT